MEITESQLRRIVKRLINEDLRDERPSIGELRQTISNFENNPRNWDIVYSHFLEWSRNLNARVPGVNREVKYPGWTKDDFMYVLNRLP